MKIYQKRIMLLIALILSVGLTGFVQADEEEIEGPIYYDDEPEYHDNTGAISNSDNAADIVKADNGGSNGTEDGEITIFHDSSGIKVYSGFNKVEVIPPGSDGWVGSYDVESSQILFRPAGRPQLECPQQSGSAGWFGPCKLPEVS